MKPVSRILSALLGGMAFMLGAPAHADDSEVFTNASFLATGVRPNVLFIIDTSTSMKEEVGVYDPDKTYPGTCPAGRVYWKADPAASNIPPDCATSDQWITQSNNRCRAAQATYSQDWWGNSYVSAGFDLNGWWNGRVLMLHKTDKSDKALNPTKWAVLTAKRDWKIECREDKGNHGDDPGTSNASSSNKYPKNGTGTNDSNRWGGQNTGSQVSNADWEANYVSLYTSNYINYFNTTDKTGKVKSRFQIVHDVAVDMVSTLQGVNLGLMRYSTTNQGGMVTYPVSVLDETSRAAMIKQLDDDYKPDGFTPLSETFFEAYRYLSGGEVKYGNNSKAGGSDYKSVASSRKGNDINAKEYNSPMDYSCQTTYIVYLTDGLPTEDTDATSSIDALPGTTCAAGVNPDDANDKNGRCTEALAKYMHDTDLSDVTGTQNVTTYVIGFGDDIVKSKAFLDKVAAAGGSGQAYTQTDSAGLKATLQKILSEVQEAADTTFVAPAVSVNAFNRSQNLNELYVSVFAPSRNLHWPGNLKKYRILNRELYGASVAAPAVDPLTGYFAKGTQSLNTLGATNPDGPNTKLGGAASTLEDTGATPRKIYTYLESDKDLTVGDNAFTEANAKLTTSLLGAIDDTDRTRIIQYTRGHDIYDEDKASDFHHRMGDPMHARPAILIHGGTEDKPEGTVFLPTNDGVLHAFDMAHIPEPEEPMSNLSPKATSERWAFIPQEFLTRQNQLFKDAPTTNRRYALDGDAKVLKFDADQNGILNAGDAAYLYFGTGRGGNAYYALDVTDIDKPKFMWKIDNTVTGFTNLGRTWSTPQLGRVRVGDGTGQNKQLFVLIFGGGYDTDNDTAPLKPEDFVYTQDDSGNSLYIVDAVSGKLLWSAGKSDSATADFKSDKMTHSFPAGVTVLDTDQDRFIDRFYAADVDGKVWRFDIDNGKSASELVSGGVLASIGNGSLAAGSRNAANARRFYNTPDVASVAVRGSRPFFNIAIGSGYRGHPLNKDTQDRFYSIRDYDAFNVRKQGTYTDDAIITDAELIDVTDMTKKATDKDPGWKINFNAPEWRGEKNLGDATTAANVILFTTFTPLGEDPSNPCLSRSLNRVWGVDVMSGDPFTHWVDGETGKMDPEDRYTALQQKGIAPSVQVLADPEGGTMGICGTGQVMLKRCVDFGSAIRSYWEHK